MKITKQHLRKIIKEERARLLESQLMYHTTDPKNVGSIQQNGLEAGGRTTGYTEGGTWADQYYGTRPIYLSVQKGKSRDADYEGQVLAVDTSDLELVADLPGLVDTGAYIEEEGMYWDEGNQPPIMDEHVDENFMIYYDDLLSSWHPVAEAAIELTGTAAVLENIPPNRIQITEAKQMKITKQKLRRIIKESISSKLNEGYGDPIGSGDPVSEILQWAEEGGRVRVAGKNIWPGMGNRSGLHSYADQMVREKWAKSGDRFTKKVEALPAGTEVELQRYKNITRDRGKFVTAGVVTIVNAPAAALGPQPSKKVLKQMNQILKMVFGNSERIVSVSLYTGTDNPFGRGKVWIGTDTDGDTYLFQDNPSATEFAKTEKDDEGYWDYLGY